jgi:hypothetical protein
MSLVDLELTKKWVYTNCGPYGRDNMYYFESYGEHGWLREDGHRWYRLNCRYWFGDWIETQDKNLWEAYGGRHRAIYHVREELMTIINLRWL